MRVRSVLRIGLLTVFTGLPLMAQTAANVPASTAATAVPPLVPYAGVARDSANKPLKGPVDATFLIYKEQEGGSPVWVESQTAVADNEGHFQVQLGATAVNGLPLELFSTGEARWLEVQIAGQKPEPRALLISVPYALKAADSATLGGLPASAFALASTKPTGIAAPANSQAVVPDTNATVTTPGGTTGYLPVFTGAATVGNSILFSTATGLGVGDVPNSTAVFDVNGKSIWRGLLNISRAGTATAAGGFASYPLFFQASSFNSTTKASTLPEFQLQAEAAGNNTATPSGTFNLLYNNNGGVPTETGFFFNANGTINFAPGQTFPGAGGGSGTITGVTAGTALTGGGTTGKVTLNVDTTKVPLLATANAFTGNQSVTGTLSATGGISTAGRLTSTVATGTAPLAVTSTTVVPNLNASLLGGFSPSAFASVTAANTFAATQDFTRVGIGTTTPRSLMEVVATASQALGPVVTLTNIAGGAGAESALDLNTKVPYTTGTYNPMVRIAAVDALEYSDDLAFQSNLPGAPNNGLKTNMIILSTGQTGINTSVPTAQFEVDSNAALGTDALYAYGAMTTSGSGTIGVEAIGGGSVASAAGGAGGNFQGGYAQGTAGIGGDGIDAYAGGTAGSEPGYAGYFGGDVFVTGTISPSDVGSTIDHPLDPANRYLVHAAMESSERVNVYSGNVTTDELGVATVKLPDWFESENGDFRYQLTVVGKFAQAIISQEIANHEFKISTNASFTKVSWQVTGLRQDAYAKAHPLVVEREKAGAERGSYIHPELYGQPAEKQTQWARHPEMMKKVQQHQVKVAAATHE